MDVRLQSLNYNFSIDKLVCEKDFNGINSQLPKVFLLDD